MKCILSVATYEKTKGQDNGCSGSGNNYSAELYNWIGSQIAQSMHIQQCTSESDFTNPLLPYKSDNVSEAVSTSCYVATGRLGSVRSAPCTSSPKVPSERSLSLPASWDSQSLPLGFSSQLSTNTSSTLSDKVLAYSSQNFVDKNGEKNSQFVGLNSENNNNENVQNHSMELLNLIRPQLEESLLMQQQGEVKTQNNAQLNYVSPVPGTVHRNTPSKFTSVLAYSQHRQDHKGKESMMEECEELISSFVSKLKTGNSDKNKDTSASDQNFQQSDWSGKYMASVQQLRDPFTFDLLRTGTSPNSCKLMDSESLIMNQGSLENQYSQNAFHIASDQSKRYSRI